MLAVSKVKKEQFAQMKALEEELEADDYHDNQGQDTDDDLACMKAWEESSEDEDDGAASKTSSKAGNKKESAAKKRVSSSSSIVPLPVKSKGTISKTEDAEQIANFWKYVEENWSVTEEDGNNAAEVLKQERLWDFSAHSSISENEAITKRFLEKLTNSASHVVKAEYEKSPGYGTIHPQYMCWQRALSDTDQQAVIARLEYSKVFRLAPGRLYGTSDGFAKLKAMQLALENEAKTLNKKTVSNTEKKAILEKCLRDLSYWQEQESRVFRFKFGAASYWEEQKICSEMREKAKKEGTDPRWNSDLLPKRGQRLLEKEKARRELWNKEYEEQKEFSRLVKEKGLEGVEMV